MKVNPKQRRFLLGFLSLELPEVWQTLGVRSLHLNRNSAQVPVFSDVARADSEL